MAAFPNPTSFETQLRHVILHRLPKILHPQNRYHSFKLIHCHPSKRHSLPPPTHRLMMRHSERSPRSDEPLIVPRVLPPPWGAPHASVACRSWVPPPVLAEIQNQPTTSSIPKTNPCTFSSCLTTSPEKITTVLPQPHVTIPQQNLVRCRRYLPPSSSSTNFAHTLAPNLPFSSPEAGQEIYQRSTKER